MAMEPLDQAIEVIETALGTDRIRIERIILFGSRARGEEHSDSDWDLYVLVDRDLPFSHKRRLITLIKRELARRRIPNDVIIASLTRFEQFKDHPSHLAHAIAEEGIPVR